MIAVSSKFEVADGGSAGRSMGQKDPHCHAGELRSVAEFEESRPDAIELPRRTSVSRGLRTFKLKRPPLFKGE
jgi:hypothetical protein